MTQKDKNKLFDYFKDQHDLLLTGNEIDEIINKIQNADNNHLTVLMQNKISLYRFINVVVFTLLNLLLPNKAISVIVWLFIGYNIVHIIINYIKNKKYARRQNRMARKR